ncbi:MAG: MobF family relaxase, partial [Planctomycetota bacterium]
MIEEADFTALCQNRDPRTGERLTARHDENRTVGYDLNWHVPKGVSLAYAVGGDERIAAVFDRAVAETMAEIEAEAATRVRTNGRQEDRTTGNLVWGQFLHTTTRPDEQGVPDPHLHAHCFVFNVTHDPQEDRYKAAQFRELKRDANYFEARMHARLAKALHEELGYAIRRDGRQWDVAGLAPELKQKFSRRTAEIEALAAEHGVTNAEQKAELGARTRKAKANRKTFPELQTEWRSRLTADEADAVADLKETPIQEQVLITPEAAVRQPIDHCFERESVVPERKVLAEALRIGAGSIDVRTVAAEAERQGLRTRTLEGRRLSTTPAVLADERAVLDFAKHGRGSVEPLNPNWMPEKDSFLSEEQTDAVQRLAGSRDRLQLLLGGA